MKLSFSAQVLLLIGLFTWGFSESNVLNGDFGIQNKIEVFDHDLGDNKIFPQNYKVVVNWGNQKYIYGSGNRTVVLKQISSWSYDLSWVPFFKSYRQTSTWEVQGMNFDRSPIDLHIKLKRFGFVSRSEMISDIRQEVSRKLIKSFQSQTFYQLPFLNNQSNFIFSKCSTKSRGF